MKKAIYSIIMIVTLIVTIFANPLTVTATLPNLPGEGITYVPLPAISIYETLRDSYNDGGSPLAFIANAIKNSGYLDPRIPGLEDLSSLDDYILNNQPDLHGETEEETAYNVSDYIINNVSIDKDNNTITYNDNSKQFINGFIDNAISEKIDYIYTIDIKQHPSIIPNTQTYLSLAQTMNALTHVNNESIFCVRINGGICQYAQIPYSNYPYAFCKSYTINNGWNGSAWICGFIKDGLNNSDILGNRQTTDQKVTCMTWRDTEFIENSITWGGGFAFYGLKNPDNWVAPYGNDKYLLLSYGKTQAIRYLTTNATTEDILYQDYYINDTVYNDWRKSSGDYTYSPQNINTVDYGTVTNYIDSFNTENGVPPTPIEVNNYISQQNEQNYEDSNPGGSGGNGDDPGGSGGNGSGDSSIFDWLKTLGAALGNLIKGVGEFLSEIVAGLVDAVTNLLQAISTLISGVLESLTNIFSGLIEFIYAGLPDDIRNILSLALVVAILITVLKLIRGN